VNGMTKGSVPSFMVDNAGQHVSKCKEFESHVKVKNYKQT